MSSFAEAGVDQGFVWINDVKFKLAAPVGTQLLAGPLPKVDSSNDPDKDETIMSSLVFPDGEAGIGMYKLTDASQVQYSYWSQLFSYRNFTTLPEQVTTMGAPAGLSSPNMDAAFDFGTTLYASWNGQIFSWNDTTQAWSASIYTLPGAFNAAKVVTYNGTDTLFIAYNGGMVKTTNPSSAASYTAATNTSDGASGATFHPRYLQVWDTKFFYYNDSTGALWYSTDGGVTWILNATVQLSPSWVQGLAVYYDSTGNDALHIITRLGLYWLNYSAGTNGGEVRATKVIFPPHPDMGRGFCEWRNDFYMSAGLDVVRYIVQPVGTLDTDNGLNRFYGLPTQFAGTVTRMIPGFNEVYALVDATTAGTVSPTTYYSSGALWGSTATFATPAAPSVSGYTTVMAWNGAAWRVVWQSSSNATSGSALMFSQSNSKLRVIWGNGGTAYYAVQPRTLRNPQTNPIAKYQLGPLSEIKPWFNSYTGGRKKLGVMIICRTRNCSANQTVTLDWGLDLNDTVWNPAYDLTGNINNVITTDGLHEFLLEPAQLGQAFDYIRLRETLQTNDATKAPSVEYLGMYYVNIPRQRWGHTLQIIVDDSQSGKTPTAKLQRDMLHSIMPDRNPTTGILTDPSLVRINFHDATTNPEEDLKCLIFRATAQEGTGDDFSGRWSLSISRILP